MNTIEETEYKEVMYGEVNEILSLCAVESDKKNGIDKYFAVMDENNGQFSDKEEQYKYADYKRDILNALIEKVKAEPVDGAAKIIHFAQVRLELLRDTPKFIAQQILSAADIKAEFERYGRWTNGYDPEWTKAVFEQLKCYSAQCEILARCLLDAADEVLNDAEGNSFKKKLTAYFSRNGININEQEPDSKEPEKDSKSIWELSDILNTSDEDCTRRLIDYIIDIVSQNDYRPKIPRIIYDILYSKNIIPISIKAEMFGQCINQELKERNIQGRIYTHSMYREVSDYQARDVIESGINRLLKS